MPSLVLATFCKISCAAVLRATSASCSMLVNWSRLPRTPFSAFQLEMAVFKAVIMLELSKSLKITQKWQFSRFNKIKCKLIAMPAKSCFAAPSIMYSLLLLIYCHIVQSFNFNCIFICQSSRRLCVCLDDFFGIFSFFLWNLNFLLVNFIRFGAFYAWTWKESIFYI